MPPLSILDLAFVPEGGTPADALRNTLDLAQHAEKWGYRRFWLAEHHNMVGIASAATAVVISYVAAGTRTIRVGAGGIMLPNHSPLVVAEQFGTLESLYPGRIDLGLGRAPGTDANTARALRRSAELDADSFPNDVMELQAYFRDAVPGQRIRAVPGAGLAVPSLRRGHPGPVQPPVDSMNALWTPAEKAGVEHSLAYAIVGSRETVGRGLERFAAQCRADELMVTAQIYDHAARVRSYEIVAEVS